MRALRRMWTRDRWRLLLVTLGVSAVWLAAVIVWSLASRPYDPLLPFLVQEVTIPDEQVVLLGNQAGNEASMVLPVLHVRGGVWPDLPVTAVKCSTEATTVSGEVWWRSLREPCPAERAG